jgi:hypothetical protein
MTWPGMAKNPIYWVLPLTKVAPLSQQQGRAETPY